MMYGKCFIIRQCSSSYQYSLESLINHQQTIFFIVLYNVTYLTYLVSILFSPEKY
jgi:hypothetical protein